MPKRDNESFVEIMLLSESYDGIRTKTNDGTNHLYALKNFHCGKVTLLSEWMDHASDAIEHRLKQKIYHYFWLNEWLVSVIMLSLCKNFCITRFSAKISRII